jgi:hypothetical protein
MPESKEYWRWSVGILFQSTNAWALKYKEINDYVEHWCKVNAKGHYQVGMSYRILFSEEEDAMLFYFKFHDCDIDINI